MKWSILFFISTFYFIPLFCFASDKPQTCTWTNIYNNNAVETLTTKGTLSSITSKIEYESCAETIARRKRQVEVSHANKHAQKTITGGSRHACTWTSPDLPNAPSQTYTLEVRKIGENEGGEPRYESCTSAQRRRQKQWVQTEFNGHREDAENAINKERERLQQKAADENESSNRKAEKAAKKQKTASLISAAGSMAAAIKFAATCSSTAGCNYWYAALSAGLGVAAIAMGNSSNKNKQVAYQYRGGLMADGTESVEDNDSKDENIEKNLGGGGKEKETDVNTGRDVANLGPGDVSLGDPNLPGWDDIPKVRLPDGTVVTPNPSEIGPFLEKRGLKWNPGKKSITLPDGKTVSADDLNNNPEFRKYAATGAAKSFQNKLKGLGQQIADATGSTDGDGLGADGSEDATASLGGGGFSGYDKGSGGSSGGGYGLGSGGGGPGSLTAGLDKDKKDKLAGMSVKMGKNRVGVSQDNIFEMIHRRYQAKRKKKHFIEIGM